MTDSDKPAPTVDKLAETSRHHPGAGFAFCVASSVGYTLANIFLRVVTDLDPVWVSSVKAAPTLLIAIPWAAMRKRQGETMIPPAGILLALIFGSLLANYGGNVLFQWSLGVIGVAMAVSITLGAMIFSGAVLGRFVLGETLSGRMAASCGLLLGGIAVLTIGAPEANRSISEAKLAGVMLAVGAASFAGLAYSGMGAIMRYGFRHGATVASTLLVLSSVGWVALTAWAMLRIGWEGVLLTTGPQWGWMILAGAANALGFVAITKALEATTILMVNGVNASQAAMCGAAGVLLFGEALTGPLCAGIALTIVGLMIMRR